MKYANLICTWLHTQACSLRIDANKHAALLSALAWAYASISAHDKCTETLERCVAERLSCEGDSSSAYIDSLVQLGRAFKIYGKHSQAADVLNKACTALAQQGLASTLQYLEAREAHVDVLLAMNSADVAVPFLAECDALRAVLQPQAASSVSASRRSSLASRASFVQ